MDDPVRDSHDSRTNIPVPETPMTTTYQEQAAEHKKNETAAGYLLSLSTAAASSNYSSMTNGGGPRRDQHSHHKYYHHGDGDHDSNFHDDGKLKDDVGTEEVQHHEQEQEESRYLEVDDDDDGDGNKKPPASTTSTTFITTDVTVTVVTTPDSSSAKGGAAATSSSTGVRAAGVFSGDVDDTDCSSSKNNNLFFPQVIHAPPASNITVDHTYRDYSVVDEETLALLDHIDENGDYKHPNDASPLSFVQAKAIKKQLKQMKAIFGSLGPTRKNSGGVTQPFPEKLMEVLDRGDMDYIVTWMPHGRSFLVLQPQAFVREVLPRFFKQSKFMSFTRQLNLWGFKRLTKGPDAGSYYHELFLRGRPRLCLRMKRQKIKGTGIKLTPSADTEPNFYDISIKSPLLPPSISGKDFKPLPPLPTRPDRLADPALHHNSTRTNLNFYLEPSPPPLVASTIINPRVIPTLQQPNMSTMLQFPTVASTSTLDTFTRATATRANALSLHPGYGNQQAFLYQLRTPTEASGNFIESSNRIAAAQHGLPGNVAPSSMFRPVNPSSLAIANTNQLTYPQYLSITGNSRLINPATYATYEQRLPQLNHQHLSFNRHINVNSEATMDRNTAFDDRQQAIHAAQQLLLQIDPTYPETLVSMNQSESATIESLKRRLLAAAQSLDHRIVSQPYQNTQAFGASFCTPSAAISIPHQHFQSPINTIDRDSYKTNISLLLSALEQTQRVAAVQQENHLLKQYANELSSAALQRQSSVTGIPFPHNFHRSSISTASPMLITTDQVEQQPSSMHVIQHTQHPRNFPTPFDST